MNKSGSISTDISVYTRCVVGKCLIGSLFTANSAYIVIMHSCNKKGYFASRYFYLFKQNQGFYFVNILAINVFHNNSFYEFKKGKHKSKIFFQVFNVSNTYLIISGRILSFNIIFVPLKESKRTSNNC